MVEKSWTFEQVYEAQKHVEETDPTMPSRTQPIHRWSAMHKLDDLERQFKAGDGFSLLLAIRVCANHDLPLPDWAARAYIARFDKVLTCRVGSWDDAFRRPFRKGLHLGRARSRRGLRVAVLNRVREILASEPETPIDDGLFEHVGAEFDIGKTLANKLYYEAERWFGFKTLPRKP